MILGLAINALFSCSLYHKALDNISGRVLILKLFIMLFMWGVWSDLFFYFHIFIYVLLLWFSDFYACLFLLLCFKICKYWFKNDWCSSLRILKTVGYGMTKNEVLYVLLLVQNVCGMVLVSNGSSWDLLCKKRYYCTSVQCGMNVWPRTVISMLTISVFFLHVVLTNFVLDIILVPIFPQIQILQKA